MPGAQVAGTVSAGSSTTFSGPRCQAAIERREELLFFLRRLRPGIGRARMGLGEEDPQPPDHAGLRVGEVARRSRFRGKLACASVKVYVTLPPGAGRAPEPVPLAITVSPAGTVMFMVAAKRSVP